MVVITILVKFQNSSKMALVIKILEQRGKCEIFIKSGVLGIPTSLVDLMLNFIIWKLKNLLWILFTKFK